MAQVPTEIDALPVFDENEAAVVDTFVVPSYLRMFWEATDKFLLVGEAARVVVLGALTGYPVEQMLRRLPNTTGVGIDPSESCVALASSKLPSELFRFFAGNPTATRLEPAAFSHALVLHPVGRAEDRQLLLQEAARLLYAEGQLLLSLPLSGSFAEIIDLLEEFSLKYDDTNIARALEHSAAERPTIEMLADELEAAGFRDIDFDVVHESLVYDSGRAFLEDPALRYFITPQLEASLANVDLGAAMEYVARAIDKYWSDSRMELGVSIAAISARR